MVLLKLLIAWVVLPMLLVAILFQIDELISEVKDDEV